MTVDALLTQLDRVRARGTDKWHARCPAHADHNPSLTIRVADDGRILMHCFSGCEIGEICAALSIRIADLFPGSRLVPYAWRQAKRQREAKRREHEREAHVAGLTIGARREAQYLIESARGLDISTWTDAQLNAVLHALADAYEHLEGEKLDAELCR